MLLEKLDLNAIQDENARELIRQLLNLVEKLSSDLRDAQIEIQRLRDEVNRLKGEQGKPKSKGNTPKPPSTDFSSETERKQPGNRHKKDKINRIQIDREQVIDVDPTVLPKDAQFKGYEKVVVQDILLRTDNILFYKKKYYSASMHKTYLAELPKGYGGQFGPGIKSMTLVL